MLIGIGWGVRSAWQVVWPKASEWFDVQISSTKTNETNVAKMTTSISELAEATVASGTERAAMMAALVSLETRLNSKDALDAEMRSDMTAIKKMIENAYEMMSSVPAEKAADRALLQELRDLLQKIKDGIDQLNEASAADKNTDSG